MSFYGSSKPTTPSRPSPLSSAHYPSSPLNDRFSSSPPTSTRRMEVTNERHSSSYRAEDASVPATHRLQGGLDYTSGVKMGGRKRTRGTNPETTPDPEDSADRKRHHSNVPRHQRGSPYIYIGRLDGPPFVFSARGRVPELNRIWLKYGTIDEEAYLSDVQYEIHSFSHRESYHQFRYVREPITPIKSVKPRKDPITGIAVSRRPVSLSRIDQHDQTDSDEGSEIEYVGKISPSRLGNTGSKQNIKAKNASITSITNLTSASFSLTRVKTSSSPLSFVPEASRNIRLDSNAMCSPESGLRARSESTYMVVDLTESDHGEDVDMVDESWME